MSENLYLLGHPISHSKSPAMYQAVYDRMGLNWTYDLKDCATKEEAQSFLDERRYLSINVTTPYKPLAYDAATARAASAKLARGANLLVKKGDVVMAFNTDGQGCVSYLERTGCSFAGARVAVCGTGPTALAILHACAQAGADQVLLLSRDKRRSRAALTAYVETLGELASATIDLAPAKTHHRTLGETYEKTSFKFGSYATSTKAIAASDLIVNATPLGMHPDDASPISPMLFHASQTAFDAVYGHGETAFFKAARAAGAVALDGSGMLVAQAVATVSTLCDINGIATCPSSDDLFDVMEAAAGFTC